MLLNIHDRVDVLIHALSYICNYQYNDKICHFIWKNNPYLNTMSIYESSVSQVESLTLLKHDQMDLVLRKLKFEV